MPRSQSQSAECYLAKYRFACSTPLNFARTASAQIKSNALEEGQRLPQSFESVRFRPIADTHKQMSYIADRNVPAGSCFGLDGELPWKRKALLT
jgi:hypothetical protein